MRALVLDSSTAGFDALLDRRRRSGLARLDEVWSGVLHMIPAPSLAYARIAQQLADQIEWPSREQEPSPPTLVQKL